MKRRTFRLYRILYPIALLYGLGVWVRNVLFDTKYLKSRSFHLPIISVGNISVGGTGKTPHIEMLIRLLSRRYQIAVLSRGYRRHSKGFQRVKTTSSVTLSGDEPLQMKQKYPHIHMAVDKNRCHGIERLLTDDATRDTQVVLLDDAFQHRYVSPGINIVLMDYHRLIKDDALMPVGRLREPARQLKRASLVIVTKCPTDLTPLDYNLLSKRVDIYPYQSLYFTAIEYKALVPVFTDAKERLLSSVTADDYLLLLTGIASPARIEEKLKKYTSQVTTASFPDHHTFTAEDMQRVKNTFMTLKEGQRIIVTTEKDAVRLKKLPCFPEELKPYIYALPIEVVFLNGLEEHFFNTIEDYVRKNSRNRSLH
jgi:tetraacyldisaccharide 4'-kinase